MNKLTFKYSFAGPGGNMSYIPPWMTASTSGSHYPAHMLSHQTPNSSHHSPITSSPQSLHSHSHLYPSLPSPNSKSHISNSTLTSNSESLSKSGSDSRQTPSCPSPESPSTSSSPTPSAAAAAAAAVAVAVAASAHLSNSPSSSTPNTHVGVSIPHQFESQNYNSRSDASPPRSSLHGDLKSEIPGLHSLPELALGFAGPSSAEHLKTHRKYVNGSFS